MTIRHWFLGCAAMAALSLPSAAHAQRADDLLISGARVRVTPMQSERLVGTAERLTVDTLTVAVSGGSVVVRYPTSQLERIEVSEGRDRFSSAVTAGEIGAVIGAVIGAAILTSGTGERSLGTFVGFLVGGVEGAAFGAIGGALLAPEHWHEVWPRGRDR